MFEWLFADTGWLMSILPYVVIGLMAALAAIGTVYRLTPTEVWPPAVRWLGASAWYGVATLAGALAYAVTFGKRFGSDGGKAASGIDQVDAETTDDADQLKNDVDEATDDETNPTDEQLADDFDELAD
jgi:hypothetical protein